MSAGALLDPAATAAELLERCRRALGPPGEAEVEAYAQSGSEIEVRCEKGDLQIASSKDGEALGLRVLDGGRLGFASTNQLRDDALARCAADARALAACSPPDPHNVLPDALPSEPDPGLWSDELAALDTARAVELAVRLLDRLKSADPRVRVDHAQVSLSRGVRAVASSRGTGVAEADCALAVSAMGMAVDGEAVGGFDIGVLFTRSAADLEGQVDALAREAASTWVGNLHPRPLTSYQGPVLFAPDAFLSVFARPLLAAASALAVQRGRSALAGKLGTRVAHESLTLTDEPGDRALSGAGRFDREGQPAGRTTVVGAGVLETWLHNAYTAHADGVRSTGHAAGGAHATPMIAPAAPVVAPGSGGDRDALVRALGKGLLVGRFSGTVEPASGDFSGVAKSARAIESGEVVGAVGETLISGNVFEVLAKSIVLGSRSEAVHGSARSPWVLVDGVSVTGG